ncbi:hypothetical protein C8R44DRAFT_930256 [Mycena epipterygia]|nr:hypothetical protein C8R44DRAFT_930256 [Mycena epipterygia]
MQRCAYDAVWARERMREYAGCKLFGIFGVPLRVYPGLKINFISPAFLTALRAFSPTIIHLVDPIWLGVQSLLALHILFPTTAILTSHHTNLPTHAAVFGYPCFHNRIWAVHVFLHSFARCTLVPSESTWGLLGAKGWRNLRVAERGVEGGGFDPLSREEPPPPHSHVHPPPPAVRAHGAGVCRGRAVSGEVAAFVQAKGARKDMDGVEGEGEEEEEEVVWTGQLTGRRLGEAVASGDLLSSPSITETFGQVTLQGMASDLPVVGLWVEGTAGLVSHGRTGLLLDVERAVREGWAGLGHEGDRKWGLNVTKGGKAANGKRGEDGKGGKKEKEQDTGSKRKRPSYLRPVAPGLGN